MNKFLDIIQVKLIYLEEKQKFHELQKQNNLIYPKIFIN